MKNLSLRERIERCMCVLIASAVISYPISSFCSAAGGAASAAAAMRSREEIEQRKVLEEIREMREEIERQKALRELLYETHSLYAAWCRTEQTKKRLFYNVLFPLADKNKDGCLDKTEQADMLRRADYNFNQDKFTSFFYHSLTIDMIEKAIDSYYTQESR